jgi:hypothetical protein
MLPMEFIAEIRRRHFVSGESISSIARWITEHPKKINRGVDMKTD